MEGGELELAQSLGEELGWAQAHLEWDPTWEVLQYLEHQQQNGEKKTLGVHWWWTRQGRDSEGGFCAFSFFGPRAGGGRTRGGRAAHPGG